MFRYIRMTAYPVFYITRFPPIGAKPCSISQVFKVIDERCTYPRVRNQQEAVCLIMLKRIPDVLNISLADCC